LTNLNFVLKFLRPDLQIDMEKNLQPWRISVHCTAVCLFIIAFFFTSLLLTLSFQRIFRTRL